MQKEIPTSKPRAAITYDHILTLPTDTTYNIDKLNASIKRFAIDILGHPCFSGVDILIKSEESLIRDIRNSFANDYIVGKQGKAAILGDAISLRNR